MQSCLEQIEDVVGQDIYVKSVVLALASTMASISVKGVVVRNIPIVGLNGDVAMIDNYLERLIELSNESLDLAKAYTNRDPFKFKPTTLRAVNDLNGVNIEVAILCLMHDIFSTRFMNASKQVEKCFRSNHNLFRAEIDHGELKMCDSSYREHLSAEDNARLLVLDNDYENIFGKLVSLDYIATIDNVVLFNGLNDDDYAKSLSYSYDVAKEISGLLS